MGLKTIQDILPLVEQASRYLGSEINTVKKEKNSVKISICLAFPELYDIGTSHFGLQILYHILNKNKDISAERVFAPGVDMESYMRLSNISISSLESKTPLNEFDIIGFSLLYELNFTNILTILDLAKIPFLSSQRDGSHPIIIAGGPCTCNPEPVADFFDAMVVGDGEEVVLDIAQTWINWRYAQNRDREELLIELSKIQGVYIPSFFKTEYNRDACQKLLPKFSNHSIVKKAVVKNISKENFPDKPILPFGRPVHDRLRLEIARGCSRGCRFCQAGMIYRPVRERSEKDLVLLADKGIAETGYEDLSLLSLSTGDYSCLAQLMETLMGRYRSEKISISLPSIRADTLTPKLMGLIKEVRKTGFTIAPEAGSQRLRNVINKNITKEEIINTVNNAFDMGWNIIKLYFMVGLPTETKEDLRELIELVKDIRDFKVFKGRKKKINVSVATFIPKAHTPFQWEPQISLEESKKRINFVRENLKIRGVNVKWQNPEVSVIEGMFARGDRNLSGLLTTAYNKGCRLDAWTDKFKYDIWKEAICEVGVDIDFYTTRTRSISEPLPWDHVDIRVKKEFLIREKELGIEEKKTPDCRRDKCNACGVCDFKEIEPHLVDACTKDSKLLKNKKNTEPTYKKIKISYSKTGEAKYFGHLELVNIFLRAIRRAKIPVKYSKGFHPKPKIAFEDPLPIGMESLYENFHLTVESNIGLKNIFESLKIQLPVGIDLVECNYNHKENNKDVEKSDIYSIKMDKYVFDEKKLNLFTNSSEFFITRVNKKKRCKEIDIKKIVLNIEIKEKNILNMQIKIMENSKIRPMEIIKEIFKLPEETVKMAKVVKVSSKEN